MVSGKLRILLAERDPSAAEVVKALLEGSYQIDVVSDGATALDWARVAKPDLIITAILLPKLDGFQVCRELKGRPDTAPIPVLVLSSLLAERHVRQVGADAFLPKPVDSKALWRTVARLVGRAQGRIR